MAMYDVDVIVKPLYGHLEEAEKGYNPKKPGRPKLSVLACDASWVAFPVPHNRRFCEESVRLAPDSAESRCRSAGNPSADRITRDLQARATRMQHSTTGFRLTETSKGGIEYAGYNRSSLWSVTTPKESVEYDFYYERMPLTICRTMAVTNMRLIPVKTP
jgi:hypothetical protein